MNTKGIIITSICIVFSVAWFIWGCLWMVMAKDLKEIVIELEQEIIDYKWQLEQVPYICGGEDEK